MLRAPSLDIREPLRAKPKLDLKGQWFEDGFRMVFCAFCAVYTLLSPCPPPQAYRGPAMS